MVRKVVDIDGAALAEAARYLGTTAENDTVEAALSEVIDRGRRTEAIARMRALVAAGEIDTLPLRRFTSGDPTLAARTGGK
ncbi:hypothetical protein ACFXK0_05325 [Nocardia sp. NPDC059177]|uniref:hypothetical protein n=1 Tax=Nocardia sp. NPDC059177 TaxID=3346759 RepID=UPI0036B16DE3